MDTLISKKFDLLWRLSKAFLASTLEASSIPTPLGPFPLSKREGSADYRQVLPLY